MNETNLNGPITLAVTPAAGLLDEPLHIRLRGVPPDAEITVRAHLLDPGTVPWSSHAHPFQSRHCHYPGAGHLMRPPGVPASVLQGKFVLGGAGPAQARANRAAWSETLAFLGTSLGVPAGADIHAAIGGERCR